VPLYRYNNVNDIDRFYYTTDWNEYGNGAYQDYVDDGEGNIVLQWIGEWRFEFIQGYVTSTTVPNFVPIYRYHQQYTIDYYYTTIYSGDNISNVYFYDGIQCQASEYQFGNLIPVYRYYRHARGYHYFTTNYNDLGAGTPYWSYEGIQFYISPTSN